MTAYPYRHYTVPAEPGSYTDSYREKEFEGGDISYALIQPNPNYDDDSMLLRWNERWRRWMMNFSHIIRGGKYKEGEPIRDYDDCGERASLILLGHFGHEKIAGRFTPEEISGMSPDKLRGLAD